MRRRVQSDADLEKLLRRRSDLAARADRLMARREAGRSVTPLWFERGVRVRLADVDDRLARLTRKGQQ